MRITHSIFFATGLGVVALAHSSATIAADPAALNEPTELIEQVRCNVCHDAVEQRLGPSWSAIADRYADDPQALDILRASTRAGSTGVWGKPPMPPVRQDQLSDDGLTAVLSWVLDR